MNAAVDRFRQMEASRLARIATEAAKAALERLAPRLVPTPARAFDFTRRPANAPEATTGAAPARPRRAPKTCTLCGATGHRRNSPEYHPKEGAPPVDGAAESNTAPAAETQAPAVATPAVPPAPAPAPESAPALMAGLPEEAPAPTTPGDDPSDDDDFIPDAVARARARGSETATGRVRAKSIAVGHLTRVERRAAALVVYPEHVERPRTRGDCQDGPRPCPFVSCAHHLFLDVNEETGTLKLNFPDKEVWELVETCALDVADRGGTTLEDVGAMNNITRERVRQIEMRAIAKMKRAAPELADAAASGPELAGVEDRLGWR